ncbi:response regulator [Actinoplanes sp. TFC3]|uniref:response regulator n=1 Tax=Actinoplanes sp. TFC3 TaxID=1710355 RepID=UPI00083084C6|nr:response regulator [Actinoplanes sp. TFC3]
MATLLLAEDVDDIAMVLTRVFKRAGFTVLHGADGAAAYDLAVEHRPDVVLTDLGMPRMDGWELIRLIRAHKELSETPIAILTGQLQPGDVRVPESGACSLVLKPTLNDVLVSVMTELAGHGPHGHTFSSTGCITT